MTERRGFTLVELAIVMTIIGLLIGGILKGQELLKNARMTSTIAQVKSFGAAVVAFQDSFGGLPGDMTTAAARVPNCTVANSCIAGDGNGMVGIGNDLHWYVGQEDGLEQLQFWKHLALANMIGGISATAAAPLVWGQNLPASKLGGGFHAKTFITDGTIWRGANGLNLLTNMRADGGWLVGAGGPNESPVLTPGQAAQMDRKMDDGMALTGKLLATSHNWGSGCGLPVGGQGTTGYNEGMTTAVCNIAIEILP